MTSEIPIGAYLQSEAEFLGTVIDYAQAQGWRARHVLETRHHAKVIGPGFPDLVLVRPPRIVIAELKRQDAPKKLPPDQAEWLALFERCAQLSYGLSGNPWRWRVARPWNNYFPNLTVCLWRPADWPDIEKILA